MRVRLTIEYDADEEALLVGGKTLAHEQDDWCHGRITVQDLLAHPDDTTKITFERV